jgi:hypothetical protein
MRGFVLRCGIGLGVAFGLAACMASPGPGDYASYSAYHQQRAKELSAAAQNAQSVANYRAAHGDYAGASAAQAAADHEAAAAQRQQVQANKDRFLSGF